MALEDAKNEVDTAITRNEPRGLSYENPFGGVPSFLRRKLTKDLAGIDLAVTGIPFDQAVTNRSGTRFGPRAIREASLPMAGDVPYGWGYSPLEEFAIADFGDVAFDYAKPSDVPAVIEAHIAGILNQGTATLTLGGDHSITLGILRAYVAKFGPVGFLQFDAHPDTWADDDATRVDHGTFVYTALKAGLIDPAKCVQVGTRVEVEGEEEFGLTRIDAPSVHGMGAIETAQRIKKVLGDTPTYLSFDIDGMDPAFAPGTGTPVWGGLTSAQVPAIMRELAGIRLLGMDIVEVSPPFDHANVTAMMAAHVAYEMIALWGWSRRNRL